MDKRVSKKVSKEISKEVSFEQAEGYVYVEGGICAAGGYQANGLNCGLNPVREKNDLALLVSEVPARAAAVYTRNKVKGAPILVCRDHLEKTGNTVKAVIANSKNANTCNADGVERRKRCVRWRLRPCRERRRRCWWHPPG